MIGYEIKSWEIRQIVRILRDLEFCDASTIRGRNAIRMGKSCIKKIIKRHAKNRTNTEGSSEYSDGS